MEALQKEESALDAARQGQKTLCSAPTTARLKEGDEERLALGWGESQVECTSNPSSPVFRNRAWASGKSTPLHYPRPSRSNPLPPQTAREGDLEL
jgi:hypothetical protein